MWVYSGKGASIPGVPMWDMTDVKFEAVCEEYDKGFAPEQKGSLKHCGLYKHVKDAPNPAVKPDLVKED